MLKKMARLLSKSERGASLVEFALVIPILLTLVMGIIEFGWLFNGWITITGAAREGARLAVVGKDFDEIDSAVKNHAATLDNVNVSLTTGEAGEQTVVSVSGNLPLLVGFFPISNPFGLSAEANMRQEI